MIRDQAGRGGIRNIGRRPITGDRSVGQRRLLASTPAT